VIVVAGYEDFEGARIKHLELIQGVISRLGNNGFLMKGWAVTVAAAFFGFAVESKSWPLALVVMPATFAFWALDAYFLRSERLFRELYRRVTIGDQSVSPFFMAATCDEFAASAHAAVGGFWAVLRSETLAYFFGPIIGSAPVVVAILLASTAK